MTELRCSSMFNGDCVCNIFITVTCYRVWDCEVGPENEQYLSHISVTSCPGSKGFSSRCRITPSPYFTAQLLTSCYCSISFQWQVLWLYDKLCQTFLMWRVNTFTKSKLFCTISREQCRQPNPVSWLVLEPVGKTLAPQPKMCGMFLLHTKTSRAQLDPSNLQNSFCTWVMTPHS